MGQVKIYALKTTLQHHGSAISDAIHDAVIAALAYPKDKKFHRLLALNSTEFLYPNDRSEHYTIIEISLFEGRTTEAKKMLIQLIFQNIQERTGIKTQDVEITLFETPKANWGIRGMCSDEMTLNYKVEV